MAIQKQLKALVADDDVLVRKRLAQILKDIDFEVESVKSGEEAIKSLLKKDKDLVVLDFHMEPLGGIELIKAVRKINIKMPIVVVTGDESMQTECEVRQKGVYSYFIKPIEVEIFKKTVLAATGHGR